MNFKPVKVITPFTARTPVEAFLTTVPVEVGTKSETVAVAVFSVVISLLQASRTLTAGLVLKVLPVAIGVAGATDSDNLYALPAVTASEWVSVKLVPAKV